MKTTHQFACELFDMDVAPNDSVIAMLDSHIAAAKLAVLEELFRQADARAVADWRNVTTREDWLYAWDDLRAQLRSELAPPKVEGT